MSLLSTEALKQAASQVGQHEKPIGSNWGTPVKDYLASVGITFAASWCMAFIYWCFAKAAKKLNIPNTAIKSAGVMDVWDKLKISQKKSTPVIGALFFIDHGSGLGHTGIVEKFDDTYIYTIEGNTNDTGSREGYIVCRRKRLISTIKGYVIY